MIAGFGDKATEALYHGVRSKQVLLFPPDVARVALRRLDVLNAAKQLLDLQSPPGNRLESLRGDLKGYYSIRVNDQWRVIFRWSGSNARDVRLIDYH